MINRVFYKRVVIKIMPEIIAEPGEDENEKILTEEETMNKLALREEERSK